MNDRLARASAGLGLTLLLAFGQASAASASCMPPPPVPEALAEAEIVLVGTVVAVTNGARWAQVRVEETWKGPDLPPVVQVRGGPGGNMATSVDRTYETGTRYLIVAGNEPGSLTDNACSVTQPWTEELAAHRPGSARPPATPAPTATPAAATPAAEGDDTTATSAAAGPLVIAGTVGIAALMLGALALLARRSRRA